MVSLSSLAFAAFVAHASSFCPGDLGHRPTGRPDDRGDADSVTPGTAHRPARPAARERTRATRWRWPTAYCGSPPPHRCTCVSTGTPLMPASSASSASDRATSAPSVACRVDSSPTRPSDVRRIACSPPISRTQSHLAKENVLALIPRRSTGGTRKPERSGRPRDGLARERDRHHGDAGRLDVGDVGGDVGRDLRQQPGGRCGRGREDDVASAHRSRASAWSRRSGPNRRHRGGAHALERRGGSRRPAATAPGSRPIPPGSAAKTGTSLRGTAAACSRSEPRRAMSSSCGTVAAAESCRARPA